MGNSTLRERLNSFAVIRFVWWHSCYAVPVYSHKNARTRLGLLNMSEMIKTSGLLEFIMQTLCNIVEVKIINYFSEK